MSTVLTLKEVNTLNKQNLTKRQIQDIHDIHGYNAIIADGEIEEFAHKNFSGHIKEFMQKLDWRSEKCYVPNA